MKRGLFTVIADGFKFNVIARNKEEVKEHCFKCFDFDYISITFCRDIYSDCDFPQFMEDYKYAG